MKMHLLSAFAVVFAANGAQAATRYELDPAHSRAGFSIRHMMVSNVKGEFGGVTGEVMLDEKDPSRSSVKATIDAKTLSTGNAQRDGHLKSPEFFDVEKFPTITFESTKVSRGKGKGKGTFKVEGNLTIHGVTKPVTLDVEELTPPVMNPMMKANARGASASTSVNRKDFGLTWAGPALEAGGVVIGDTVKLSVDVEMVEKAAAAAPAPTDAKPPAPPSDKATPPVKK